MRSTKTFAEKLRKIKKDDEAYAAMLEKLRERGLNVRKSTFYTWVNGQRTPKVFVQDLVLATLTS